MRLYGRTTIVRDAADTRFLVPVPETTGACEAAAGEPAEFEGGEGFLVPDSVGEGVVSMEYTVVRTISVLKRNTWFEGVDINKDRIAQILDRSTRTRIVRAHTNTKQTAASSQYI